MKTTLSALPFIVVLCFMFGMNGYAETVKSGKVTGGAIHTAPDWFKESFLEIQDDVDEAAEQDKHVILFFQLNGCPYCDRMLFESFESEPLAGYIQQNFDTIAINVRGDREIAFNDEITVTEKELSDILKVRATPAILFLDGNNKTVTRVNGYRAPQRFQQVLRYVNQKAYQQGTLAQYLDKNLEKNIYQLRDNKLFTPLNDLSSVKGPLALFFEDSSCYDCNEFHDKILSRDDVQKEFKPFTLVRLDVDSGESIVDLEGNKTTASALADNYQMMYRPGVLIFDNGDLIRRYDSFLYSHHFKEGFRFVGGGYYKTSDYRSYSQRRTEELLASGVNIDLGQ